MTLKCIETFATKQVCLARVSTDDGKVQIPEGPGAGVKISRRWLEQANHQISEAE